MARSSMQKESAVLKICRHLHITDLQYGSCGHRIHLLSDPDLLRREAAISPEDPYLQFISVSIYQRLNLSAFQFVSISIHQHFDLAAIQFVSVSIYQYFNSSTLQFISVSIYQHFNSSVLQFISVSIYQHFNSSVLQFISVSIHLCFLRIIACGRLSACSAPL